MRHRALGTDRQQKTERTRLGLPRVAPDDMHANQGRQPAPMGALEATVTGKDDLSTYPREPSSQPASLRAGLQVWCTSRLMDRLCSLK